MHVLTLSLDTSSRAGSIAILLDDTVLGVVSTFGDEAYSSRIFRQLEFLLAELKLNLNQFDLFAAAAGPGSFTGLRVGLAAVKGWSEAYQKPVAGISGLEAVAIQNRAGNALLAPLLDARRGQLYAGFYRRSSESPTGLKLEDDEFVATPDEFLDAVAKRGEAVEVVTPDSEIAAAISSNAALRDARPGITVVLRVSAVLAPWIGQLAYVRALAGKVSDALSLDANYVRRTDAEVHLKGS
jgi:tRNA threonylcarbamoyladenosine biosynthesis protein TsaB